MLGLVDGQACWSGVEVIIRCAQRGDRTDFDQEVESVCPFCGVGCQVSLKVRDGKVLYVEGIDGPANEDTARYKISRTITGAHARPSDEVVNCGP